MARYVRFGALLAALGLLALPAAASGSIGPGGVKAASRAEYARGKAVVFKELVCRNCAISRREFKRERAEQVLAEVNALLAGADASGMDAAALCRDGVEACRPKLQSVKRYLTKRYRL